MRTKIELAPEPGGTSQGSIVYECAIAFEPYTSQDAENLKLRWLLRRLSARMIFTGEPMNDRRWMTALGVVVLAVLVAALVFLFSGGLDSPSEPDELRYPPRAAQVESATTAGAESDQPVPQTVQADPDAAQEEASAPSVPPADVTPDEPKGEPTMEIDFEDTNVHGIIHYITLRSGLNIQVHGEIQGEFSVSAKSYLSDPKEAAKELLRDVCEAADLELTEHDDFIIIKSAE